MNDAQVIYRWKDPSLPPDAPALAVYFLEDAQVNETVTRETGVQTYDSVLVAYISPMGRPKSNAAHEIKRTFPDGTVKVNQLYANKYGEQLKAYEAGHSAEALGTPLKDLVGMSKATAMNLRARGISTIEMLADMTDNAGGDIMGFWELRDKAKKHIETREKNAPKVHLEMELAERDRLIASMQRQMDDLKALIEDKGKTKKAA